MGALLARKKDVSSQLQQRKESPLQQVAQTAAYLREQQAQRTKAPPKKPDAKPGDQSPKGPTRDETTTTSRLLEMKRKRREEDEDK
jgi:hypothetical protein